MEGFQAMDTMHISDRWDLSQQELGGHGEIPPTSSQDGATASTHKRETFTSNAMLF